MAAWNSENKKAGKSENKIKLTKRDSESPEGTPKKKVKKKVTMPNEKELTKCVKKILHGADLETITMKQVPLIKKVDVTSLTGKKIFID